MSSHRALRAGQAALLVAATVGLLWLYGALPGMVPDAASRLGGTSLAQCLVDQLPRVVGRCPAIGAPQGVVIANGYPYQLLVGLVQRVVGDLTLAADVVLTVVIVVALVGARRLAGVLTDRAWLAWGAAVVFLLSPVVLQQGGYGPMQAGFALVPAVVVLDLALLRRLEGAVDARPGARLRAALPALALAAAVVLVRVLALFLDGYSFVMTLLLVGAVQVVWGVRVLAGRPTTTSTATTTAPAEARPGGRRVALVALAALVALVGVVVAVRTYAGYLGSDALEPMPLDFFRGQGVDVVARLAGSPVSVWSDLTGWYLHVADVQGYSDGHNLRDVSLGWGLVLAVVAGLVVAVRDRRRPHDPARDPARRPARWLVGVVAVVVLAALALGTGPSLKVGDFRPVQDVLRAVPTFEQYLMPAREAGPATPWAAVYQAVPGIETMRALYRWDLLVRLGLVLLAVVALDAVAARHRVAALLLGLLVVVDVLPTPVDRVQDGARVVTAFERDAVDPLRDVLRPGERVVLLNPAVGGSTANTLAADDVCVELRLRCANAGGDKAAAEVSDSIPDDVADLLVPVTAQTAPQLATRVRQVLETGRLDAVVLVSYDLRANAYAWPPTEQQRAEGRAAAATVARDGSLTAVDRGWSIVVRRAVRGSDATSG